MNDHICVSANGPSPRQVLTKAINEFVVTSKGNDRAKANTEEWPLGPQAPKGESTEKDVTWRGGGMPEKYLDFFSDGKQFRTNMFLATSFEIRTAQSFRDQVRLLAFFVAPCCGPGLALHTRSWRGAGLQRGTGQRQGPMEVRIRRYQAMQACQLRREHQ